VTDGAERGGDAPRGVQLDPVALIIVDGEGKDGKAPLPRDCGGNHRVEPSRQEDDGGRARGGHCGRGASGSGRGRQADGRLGGANRPSTGSGPTGGTWTDINSRQG
jgi:hypothetical protein